ncbi:unnamed protein product [Closterium sp. Yama58-4]|nr:unnamed protein product [Closterium sp. Yama58-4]
MLAVASSSRRYHAACSSSSQPAVQIDGPDLSEGPASMVVMARFVGESDMRPFLSTDGDAAPTAVCDAVSDAINDAVSDAASDAVSNAVSDAGSEAFLFPTPPRSPRSPLEISRAALESRQRRRRHSFSGFQELPAGCGACAAPESLDGATNGDIAYPVTTWVTKRILAGKAVTATVAVSPCDSGMPVSQCGSSMLAGDSTQWPCLLIADITPLSSPLSSSLVPPTTVRAVDFKARLSAATVKTYLSTVTIQACHAPPSFGPFFFATLRCTAEVQCCFRHPTH